MFDNSQQIILRSVLQAMILANNDPEYASVLEATKGIMFMGE